MQKTIILITMVLFGAIPTFLWADSPEEKVAPIRPGWKLVFEDTFDGVTKLDSEKWFDTYRSERLEYQELLKNPNWKSNQKFSQAHYVIEDGILKIRLDRDLPKRKDILSTTVSSIQTSRWTYNPHDKTFGTNDKFTAKYGWFEIRCRMPKGNGLHSAFWLLQKEADKQEIKLDGKRGKVGDGVVEIDIFEMLGSKVDERINYFNVHFTENGHYKYHFDFDCSQEFHTWALNWEEGRLTWYLDGKEICVYEGETPKNEMLILLGLYQNCGWTGPMDPEMPYPRDFEIDYIRVWQKETN
ncbi:MAG: glycoside hydrolase family 16 protein [Planctomycetia bacterium]|nr:glycoside hydrolase family 16 protein [Planctomycetia bacterium]